MDLQIRYTSDMEILNASKFAEIGCTKYDIPLNMRLGFSIG